MICMGEMFEGYTDSGVYRDTFPGSSGCDSIRVVELEVVPGYFSSFNIEVCHGEGFEGYFDSGIYVDTLMSVHGCDSIRSIDLQVQDEIITFVETNTCSEESGGHQQPGTYVDTLTSNAGCDSIRTAIIAGATRFIPNVFSPNQDNINDIFEVFTFPDSQLALTYFVIFDRMGNMVYETRNWPIQWNGKDNKGNYYNPAVFTYMLKYICGQEEIIEPGNITLIR
jgi:gliding motility-associated-like protein